MLSPEWLDTAWEVLRVLPGAVLMWLSSVFGRTLLTGSVPLIERIARVGDPHLPLAIGVYCRRLTFIWCAYLACAAVGSFASAASFAAVSAWTWVGTLLLFVGEHRLRPHLFPDHRFPSLVQQLRDTLYVWKRDL